MLKRAQPVWMWTLWMDIGAENKTDIEVRECLTEHQTEVGDKLDEIRIVRASRQDKSAV